MESDRAAFALADDAAVEIRDLGGDGERAIVIDGAMRAPHALVDFAATQAFDADLGGLYPGPRAPLPLDYAHAVIARATPLVARIWSLGPIKPAKADCVYSIVTRDPRALAPLQRAPHIDTTHPLHFAFLHFLCDARFGGTAFFRQRATGFTAITPEREADWAAARDAAIARRAEDPGGYPAADDPDYDRIAAIPARFDRLLIYRSNVLHSGIIPAAMPRLADPRRGRLTANVFVGYRAA